jgi:hypothetical protein
MVCALMRWKSNEHSVLTSGGSRKGPRCLGALHIQRQCPSSRTLSTGTILQFVQMLALGEYFKPLVEKLSALDLSHNQHCFENSRST